MQKRSWNYKADDLTKDINRWMTGAISPGLYFGFDFAPSANMNLTLNHGTTGFKDVDDAYPAPAESAFQSLIVTRQGVFVKEDAAITINGIANGHATNPRIDVVVLSHRINEVAGGETALYSVIQGTPAGSPVAPALTNAQTQIKIGELLIPALTTALNQVGVTWTRSARPGFAGRVLIANRVVVSDSFGQDESSSISVTELNFLSGLAVNVQTGKQNTITGAATTILTSNLTANRALASDGAGKVIVSAVLDTELNTLIGLTGGTLQTQLAGKQATITGAATTVVSANFIINRVVQTNGAGKLVESAVSVSELERLAGISAGRCVTSIESPGLLGFKLRFKTIELGDWNMDTTQILSIAHGLGSDWKGIRSVSVIIRNDADNAYYNLHFSDLTGNVNQGNVNSFDSTQINMFRLTGGEFDNASFDTTGGFNRGWCQISYEIVN